MAVTRTSRFRVYLYDQTSSFGPGSLRAIIDDARSIGVSAHANDTGEMFFTLPHTHDALSEVVPRQRHYRVGRWNGSQYVTMGSGIVEDYEANKDDVVVYGHDYMGLLEGTITGSNTSYTTASLGAIVSSQLTDAIAESNSRLAFTTVGTIDTTSVTATLLTSYERRLDFIRNVAEVSMSDRSVRTMLTIPRDPPWQWTFEENRGQDRPDVRLEYGGLVSDFLYTPGFRDFATRVYAIGIKREGASILFSTQTYGDETTYGRIAKPTLHNDMVDQASLDRIAKRDARRAGTLSRSASLVLRAGSIAPWTTWELGDSVRVIVNRGNLVSINGLYTIWGLEWVVPPNGREQLFMALSLKET